MLIIELPLRREVLLGESGIAQAGLRRTGELAIEAAASAMHNILLAHGRSLQEIRDYGHKNVGIVLNKTHVVPYNNLEENKFAAQLYDQIHNKWFDDAIFNGQYPKELLKILGPFLPANYDNDLKIISKKWVLILNGTI